MPSNLVQQTVHMIINYIELILNRCEVPAERNLLFNGHSGHLHVCGGEKKNWIFLHHVDWNDLGCALTDCRYDNWLHRANCRSISRCRREKFSYQRWLPIHRSCSNENKKEFQLLFIILMEMTSDVVQQIVNAMTD